VGGLPAAVRVLSSDLSAASDLLPLDLVEALVDGFVEGCAWESRDSRFMFELFRDLTGPMLGSWSDGEGEIKRGILMGLPTTWFLLNLVHLFWIDEAVSHPKELNSYDCKKLKQATAICGDDLVAFWP